jgi:amino acid transporter
MPSEIAPEFSMSGIVGTMTDSGLRKGTLGAAGIAFMVISSVAPLTNMAGVLPIAILFGNGTGIIPAFVVMMFLVLIFAVGYVAMARHAQNAGAFYTLISRGLGEAAGGAAAMVALLAYNCMQIGISGLFGPVTSDLVASLTGMHLPWWVFSIGASALIGILAYCRVDLSVKVLSVLVLAEFAVVFLLDVLIVHHGVPGGFSLAPFSLTNMPSNGAMGVTFVFAFGCYVGFEATTIYSEEASNPTRDVPRATYGAILVIGIFYALSTIWIVEAAGLNTVLATIQKLADPEQFVFNVAGQYAGATITTLMRVLFVTSLFACLLAFHNNVARYVYVLGRDGTLPAWLGKTHAKFQSPHRGTIVQTGLAVVVIAGFAIGRLDPVLTLFSWVANISVLAVIFLLVLVSIAVIVFFQKNKTLDPGKPIQTVLMPAFAAIGFSIVAYWGVSGFSVLTGATGFLSIALPSLIPIAAIIGLARSLQMKFVRKSVA